MRYILLFIQALTFSIYSLFFGDPVTVKTNFPENAKPGSEFTAEIIINKGQLAGFAKFQLELPQGCTAKEADSKGGSFTMAGQTAKIIWTSVPSAAEFSVKMTIVVDGSASGDKIFTGKYSYIDNNVKQQADIAPVTVKLGGEASAQTTTTSTPTETATTQPTEGTAAISVTRNIVVGSGGEYEVQLKVKKDAVKGFAKLQEKIPDGFTAAAGVTEEASFSYAESEHAAKFIWTSLPSKEELLLSYKLVPQKNVTPPSPASIEGEFSYLEDQQSKKYAIARQDLPGTTPAVTTNTTSTGTANTNTVAANTNTTTTSTEPVNTNTVTETTQTQTTATTNTEPTEPTAQKNTNVHYSVQIGAFRKSIDVQAYASKYGISGVTSEMQDGLTKCIVGKHGDYKAARDSRETVKGKGVNDAFVTAYNSGRRITVQEALMISNQKWFR